MEFSYKKNQLLTLQKKYGIDWLKNLMINGALNEMQNKSNTDGLDMLCYNDSQSLLSDIHKAGKVKNIYFCKSMIDMAFKLDFRKSFIAFKSLDNDFGVIIIDNRTSVVYGIYKHRFTSVTIIDNCIDDMESVYFSDIDNKIQVSNGYSTWAGFKGGLTLEEKKAPMAFKCLFLLLTIYYFAEIETKTIEQGKSRKAIVGSEKCINETQVPIQVINSNWFTNIYRSEGFNVSGHFRLQPCGEGSKKRKLIWINGFEKQGYTRLAKKNQIDNTKTN